MKESEVKSWLYDECVSLLQNTSLVTLSSPSNHVDLANERDEQTYPFIGIRTISSTPDSQGLGSGDVFVDSISYDSNDVVQSVTRGKEVTLRVELVPTADNDRKLRTDLSDDISDHFSVLARTSAYPDDIEEVDVDEATPQNRSEEFVFMDGVPVEVTYNRYTVDSDVTAAEDVNVDIDASDTVSDDSDDADAFSRMM